jgi:hypothetical protein
MSKRASSSRVPSTQASLRRFFRPVQVAQQQPASNGNSMLACYGVIIRIHFLFFLLDVTTMVEVDQGESVSLRCKFKCSMRKGLRVL